MEHTTGEQMTTYNRNYIAIYEDRADGDFDLRAVLSPESLDRRALPIQLFWIASMLDITGGIVVAKAECNFVDVHSGDAIHGQDVMEFALPQDGTIHIFRHGDMPTVYGMFPTQQEFDNDDHFQPYQPAEGGIKFADKDVLA
jgi:hypothetical protein